MLIFPGNLPCPLPIPTKFGDSNEDVLDDDDNDANDSLWIFLPALLAVAAAIFSVRDGNK